MTMYSPSGSNQDIIHEVGQLVERILLDEKMELVDIAFRRESRGWVLRILIDKPGGITIDDCTSVSYQVSTLLDVKNVIHHPYNLEVSSPGVNRPLKKKDDFERFIGELVTIKTNCLIENRKTFTGKLTGFKDELIFLEVDGKQVAVPYTMIDKAYLEFDFNKRPSVKDIQ